MKKTGAETATLTPSASGWRVDHAGLAREAASLAEAAALLPAGARLELALPCQAALLERFLLPAGDAAELAGMAQLQLEKSLPYPLEEVTTDLVVVTPDEAQSTVLSIAVHRPVLEQLCAPLREADRLPQRITLYARHVTARGAAEPAALFFWKEQDHLVLAIAEHGRLSWAQAAPNVESAAFVGELPALLLGAEMDGVPGRFTRVYLAQECALFAQLFRETTGAPVEIAPLAGLPSGGAGNLLPPSWAAQAGRLQRKENLQQRLLLAAVVYLVLIAIGFLYLAWMKHQLQTLDTQVVRLRPLIQASQAQQARWQALEPAIEPSRYVVEILWLVYKARPGPEIHITQFDSSPAQFMVEGEAPSAAVAIDFAERLRGDPGLADFRIEAGPPSILPNDSAQFRIFGKP